MNLLKGSGVILLCVLVLFVQLPVVAEAEEIFFAEEEVGFEIEDDVVGEDFFFFEESELEEEPFTEETLWTEIQHTSSQSAAAIQDTSLPDGELDCVTVTIGQEITNYASFQDALAAAGAASGPVTITLLQNAVLEAGSFDGDIFLNLAGFTLRGDIHVTGGSMSAYGGLLEGSVLVQGGGFVLGSNTSGLSVSGSVALENQAKLFIHQGSVDGGIILKGSEPITICGTLPSETRFQVDGSVGTFAIYENGSPDPSNFLSAAGYGVHVIENRLAFCNHQDRTLTVDNDAIAAFCGVCGDQGAITLMAEDKAYTGIPYAARYTATGILEHADVALSYSTGSEEGPADLGAYTVTLTYEGQMITQEFVIFHGDLSGASVEARNCVYTGVEVCPQVTVQLNGSILQENRDYTLEISNNVQIGTGTLVVTGIGNYKGSAAGTFLIEPKTLTGDDVGLVEKTLVYTGQAQQPQTKALKDGVTFVAAEAPQTDAGNYTLRVTGTGCYQGMVELAYTILPAEAEEIVMAQQKIPVGSANFVPPEFLSLTGEPLEGRLTYSLNQVTYVRASIASALANLSAGESLEVGYTFTPSSANYRGKTGVITVTAEPVYFTVNGESATEKNAFTQKQNPVYGDQDIIRLAALQAHGGSGTDNDLTHFEVRFENGNPQAGENTFTIFYNGTVGGVTCRDMEVCSGKVKVGKAPAVMLEAPKSAEAVYNGQSQKILIPGKTEDGEIRYAKNAAENFTAAIPWEKNAGEYDVYYYIQADRNHTDSDPVKLTVRIQKATPEIPVITATYGDALKDLKLPAGFVWEDPLGTKVGAVGVNTFCVSYFPLDKNNYMTLTQYPLEVTVKPKEINPTVELEATLLQYTGEALCPAVTVKDGLSTLAPREYSVTYSNHTNPGTALATVQPKAEGNYEFEPVSLEFTIFQRKLDVSTTLPEIVGNYDSAASIRKALQETLEYDDYRAEHMLFVHVQQKVTLDGINWFTTSDPQYFPKNGVYLTLGYPGQTDPYTHFFDAAILHTTGEKEGTIGKLIPTEKTNGLRFVLRGCGVLGLAWAEENGPFAVDVIRPAYGTLRASTEEAERGELVYLRATTSRSNYALKSIAVLGWNNKPIPLTSHGDGQFSFEMPPSEVTVSAVFAKKTSSNGNPATGDPIGFCIVAMAGSGLGLAVLLEKRRKRK